MQYGHSLRSPFFLSRCVGQHEEISQESHAGLQRMHSIVSILPYVGTFRHARFAAGHGGNSSRAERGPCSWYIFENVLGFDMTLVPYGKLLRKLGAENLVTSGGRCFEWENTP